MTACKSIGFEIFRMNNNCKCTCHETKTSTILPFAKWRTNGTTRKEPSTFRPSLYHVVGTLSPAIYSTESNVANSSNMENTTDPCGWADSANSTDSGNSTVSGNSTISGNSTVSGSSINLGNSTNSGNSTEPATEASS